ncbi:MAG: hypothetical protein ACLQSR_17800 [Limisphaerales bacterium]
MANTNFVSTTNGPVGIISTVAGKGTGGYSGDGSQATNATLSSPSSVAVDSFGNFYIADQANNRVREVYTNGIITTLAGTNTYGFSGDGGLATNAMLYAPNGVAVDGAGDVFVVDWRNRRIREINTNGIINTVAGTNSPGTPGFSGDGGLAVNAGLNSPSAVAVDGAGNLFIADTGNNRIREVYTNGIIVTFAGTNSASFSGDGGAATNACLNEPDGVAVDAYEDVFISDRSNNRIRMVDASGIITTVAGTGGSANTGDGGPATNATIEAPGGLGVDSYGNLYIADNYSESIRKVDFGRVPMLQLSNVGATNVGNYDVIVTSPSGSVTSSIVSLIVLGPPNIVIQPVNTVALIGSFTNLNVVVSNNPPFAYQWFTSSVRDATAVSHLIGGQVSGVSITDNGEGYVSTPNVHFIGGGGSGATATAQIVGGEVVIIYMAGGGFGYTSPPAVEIDPPPCVNDPLLDETNATLEFSPLAVTDTTNYFVVITNNYGSVTSATANLWAFLSPQNFTAQNTGPGMQLEFNGTPFFLYTVQTATNLTPPINWMPIYTYFADPNGNWEFTDTNLNSSQKFYRAVAQ